jgi:hypothetical protein
MLSERERSNNILRFWEIIHTLSHEISKLCMSRGFPMILSSYILIILPLLGTRVKWVWRIGVVSLHRFHMGNPLSSFKGWYRHLSMLKYFLIKDSFHHSSFPDISHQTTLAPISKFIRNRSFISRPPFSFGAIFLFQLMRWKIYVLVFPPCYRNSHIYFPTFCMTLVGANKVEHWKGRADNT